MQVQKHLSILATVLEFTKDSATRMATFVERDDGTVQSLYKTDQIGKELLSRAASKAIVLKDFVSSLLIPDTLIS